MTRASPPIESTLLHDSSFDFSAHGFSSQRQRRESVFVFALGVVLFTLGLWHQPFIDFESRFAVFAQEMWRHGISLFPTTYGEPYPDYPITGTLLIWLCSLPFGGVTKFAAVLPTAVAAAFNMAILYRLLAPYSRRWAVIALCLQLMTGTFLTEARSISLDLMLATLTLLSFYCVHTAHENKRRCGLPWLVLLLLAGFAVRGPLGVVIPSAVIISYRAVNRQWRALVQFAVVALAVLIAAWGALLFAAMKIYGSEFMHDVVRMQVVGRMEKRDALPWFYYFTSSFGNYALAYPFAVVAMALTVPALWRGQRTSRQQLLLLLVVWIAIVIVGLSIPQGKKTRYLLPIVPALAAVAAYPWVENVSSRALTLFKAVLEKLFLIFPLVLIVGLVLAQRHAMRNALELPRYLPLIFVGLIAAQLCALVMQWRAHAAKRAPMLAVLAAFSIWLCVVGVVEPVRAQVHDTAAFVAHVEAQRAARPGALVLLDMAKDGEAIKYIVNVQSDVRPIFAGTAADLETVARPCYVVVGDSDLARLAPAVLNDDARVLHTRFGGRKFSAFYLP